MILEVVIELVVDEDRSLHGFGNLEGNRTVDWVDCAFRVIIDSYFDYSIGQDDHGYAESQEEASHEDKDKNGFVQWGDRQVCM